MWGDHLHHGLYPGGKARKDHQQAQVGCCQVLSLETERLTDALPQVDMIDASLDWAGVATVTSVLDVGCGIGGSTRHIARRFSASARGVTLSPVQVERASALTAEAGLAERVSFQVADALELPFDDNCFDLVWSLESGEVRR